MVVGWFMVFNATFNNISVILWWSVLLMDETRVHSENHWPVTSHWQILFNPLMTWFLVYMCTYHLELWTNIFLFSLCVSNSVQIKEKQIVYAISDCSIIKILKFLDEKCATHKICNKEQIKNILSSNWPVTSHWQILFNPLMTWFLVYMCTYHLELWINCFHRICFIFTGRKWNYYMQFVFNRWWWNKTDVGFPVELMWN
jgi:hypothetical protein